MAGPKRAEVDRIGALMHEVERAAKRLRADFRRRARTVHVPKELQAAATELRKLAARAAAQVEKYVHGVRLELERAAGPRRPVKAMRRR